MTGGSTWKLLFNIAIAAAVAFVLLACNKMNKETANIAKTIVQLENHKGVCGLTSTRATGQITTYNAGIPWPCNFHKDLAGKTRIFRSEQFEYLLIEASEPSADSDDCETHLRSIRAFGEEVEVSQHQEKVTACPPFQWDEIVFTELFD